MTTTKRITDPGKRRALRVLAIGGASVAAATFVGLFVTKLPGFALILGGAGFLLAFAAAVVLDLDEPLVNNESTKPRRITSRTVRTNKAVLPYVPYEFPMDELQKNDGAGVIPGSVMWHVRQAEEAQRRFFN